MSLRLNIQGADVKAIGELCRELSQCITELDIQVVLHSEPPTVKHKVEQIFQQGDIQTPQLLTPEMILEKYFQTREPQSVAEQVAAPAIEYADPAPEATESYGHEDIHREVTAFQETNKRGKWSNYDLEFLKMNKDMTAEEIGKHLCRSTASVEKQIAKLSQEPEEGQLVKAKVGHHVLVKFDQKMLKKMSKEEQRQATMFNTSFKGITHFDFCTLFNESYGQFSGLNEEDKRELMFKLATPTVGRLIRKYAKD